MKTFHYEHDELMVEHMRVDEIVEREGSPLYIYSRKALVDRYEEYRDAFKGHPTLVAYAMKANGNLGILSLLGSLGAGIASFGATLRDDARLQRVVNRVARRTLAGLVARHGDAIVALVSDTVKRWDAHTVTARIERVVGRDLQFIRLNGTLVGGVIGLVLYALDRFT